MVRWGIVSISAHVETSAVITAATPVTLTNWVLYQFTPIPTLHCRFGISIGTSVALLFEPTPRWGLEPINPADATCCQEERQPTSTTSLMRCSVLVMSRMLRRFRRNPPNNQYTVTNGEGLSRNDSVTSVASPDDINR